MRYSKQREQVLQAVMEKCGQHPTADDIYTSLRQINPNISLGTVYRNLSQLAENGQILKIAVANSSDRFDGCTHEHYHMICDRCGGVFDIQSEYLLGLREHVMEQTGFRVANCQLILRGICQKCGEGKEA
ncbi:MAG: transcriptional repressor [Oscillospiraceae bacterium]|nr:transcriptional repressor [Oscillospiraceae bacterium]